MENGMSVVAGRDITEFMETEEELTSLAYSLHTIKVVPGYIVVVNTQDNTIAYHPQEDLIGKSLADAVGRRCYDRWICRMGSLCR